MVGMRGVCILATSIAEHVGGGAKATAPATPSSSGVLQAQNWHSLKQNLGVTVWCVHVYVHVCDVCVCPGAAHMPEARFR